MAKNYVDVKQILQSFGLHSYLSRADFDALCGVLCGGSDGMADGNATVPDREPDTVGDTDPEDEGG